MSFAASAPAEPVQQANFNPSWIRSAFHGGISSSPRASVNEEEDHTLSHPVFVENRYGREDLLALMEKISQPPIGLSNCPFFVAEGALPIVCFPLTEAEQRQQQNINSSKAMSQLSHAERNSIAAGAAYAGSTTPNSSRGGGGGGGWTPVKSSRGSAQATASTGRGGPRPFARGARVGDSPRESDETREGYYNARFAARGGRGGATLARGGSTTASANFNSRAQGLYDPRDPKDRPRNRLRSTSDDTETSGAGDAGWTTVKTTWKEKENKNAWSKDSAAGWNGENSQTPWKNDNASMPEWMADGDKEESALSSRPGSFDEQGAYREQSKPIDTQLNNITSNERKISPEVNSWVRPEQKKEPVSNNINRAYPRTSSDEITQQRLRQQMMTETASGMPVLHNMHAAHGHAVSNPHSALGASVVGGLSSHVAPAPVAYESALPTTSVLVSQPPQFQYMDPSDNVHGPYPKLQMDAWFENGYFNDDLKVKRDCDTSFRTLGELKKLNGARKPFDFKEETVVNPNIHGAAQMYPFTSLSLWNEPSTVNMINYPAHTADMRFMGSQRPETMIANLQAQAEEQEKMMREREEAVKRKEENINKALEDERIRREAEQLELTKALEKQKKKEAEAARLREELRLMEEKISRENEEKRRMEEEARRHALQLKKEEDAERIRMHQAMLRLAEEQQRKESEELEQRKRAEEEQKRRIIEENRRLEDIALAEQLRAAKGQKTEWRMEEEVRRNASQIKKESPWKTVTASSETYSSAPDDGWIVQQAPTKKAAPKVAAWITPSSGSKTEKTLKEIQEEEERLMKLELEEKARKREETVAANIQSSGTWSNVTQRLNWNQPAKTNSSKVAWGGAGVDAPSSSPSINWDGPTLQAANKAAPAPVKKVVAPKPAPVKQVSVSKSSGSRSDVKENSFKSWVVNRLKQLNDSVDAEVLADFLKSVENPNEVEDYVEGYLGSSKASKEFVKEFLQKRCEMRNRKTDKDDLSSASVAPATVTSAGKKKKKGTRLVVDGSCLGFRPAADPNRVNQGTIEFVTATPSATARR
ncbi:unnamed protein product [Auanema sp. JU1783]|nr:unnamed protein product [Auanema sp. JU1783]